MQSFFSALWNMLFPTSCIGCGARGSALCAACLARIPFAPPTGNDRIHALYDYSNRIVQKAVRDLKYYRKSEAAAQLLRNGAPHLLALIGEVLQSARPMPFLIVPIPQHAKKSRARGFNQSELLARIFASEYKDSRVRMLLRKYRVTLPQAHLKQKTLRLTNLNDSMEAARSLDPSALYVLIDDVTTTGATFIEATRALRAGGARNILCIALAHGYAQKK